MAKSNKPDGLAALKAIAGKKPSAADKKSDIPERPLPPAVAPAVRDWLDAKKILDDAEARKTDAEKRMIEAGVPLHIEVCRADGKVHSSLRLRGTDRDTVLMTQAARWIKMPTDKAEDPLRAEFPDEFDQYFQVKTKFELDADKLTPQQAQKIAQALGDDAAELLVMTSVVEPTEKFLTDAILDDRVTKRWQRVQANEGLCKLIKPSFRK